MEEKESLGRRKNGERNWGKWVMVVRWRCRSVVGLLVVAVGCVLVVEQG